MVPLKFEGFLLSISTGRSVFISRRVAECGLWISGRNCYHLLEVCVDFVFVFVLCKFQLDLMEAIKVFKNLETVTAPLETAVEDESVSVILISYRIICPFITVKLLQKFWWNHCRNLSLLKTPLFSHTGTLPFWGKSDVKLSFFLYLHKLQVSKTSGYSAGGKKKKKCDYKLSIYSLTNTGFSRRTQVKTFFLYL